MKSEKQIENYLKKKITEAGGLCLKWASPGTAGVPDRIVIMPKGRVYFVELKAENKRNNLSAIQKAFIAKLVALACGVKVLASYEAVDRFVEEVTSK